MSRVSKFNKFYCTSKYEAHIRLIATLIVGKSSTLFLDIPAQLISKTNGNSKYVGGDFVYPTILSSNVRVEIYSFSLKIAYQVKKFGYMGIWGTDYIMFNDGSIRFLQINPRLQSASFSISYFLVDKYELSHGQLLQAGAIRL